MKGMNRMAANKQPLSRAIANIEVIELQGDPNTMVEGISMDSRTVRPGDIFACVAGFNVDGHRFAPEAVKKGAIALVVERMLPVAVPQIRVKNVRQVLGKLAAQIYGNPSQKLELVGVTGTNGKTTVTHLIEKIGMNEGQKVGLIGTLGAHIAGQKIPGSRTTPESIDLQRLLSTMVDEGVELAVMEVSSHALDLGRVDGCEFDAGIFTNLTQDHLDYHRTMENYLAAKAKLFSGLRGAKQPKMSILNGDDPAFAALKKSSAAPVFSYGRNVGVDYRAEQVDVRPDGVSFAVRFRGKTQPVHFSTPGVFSVYNALAAFAWGAERGFAPEHIAAALRAVHGVPGRFESIKLGQPFQVIVDYAHTPDGLENVLRTARGFTKGKLITVFGCGGDRDRTKRPVMGKAAAEWSDFVIVTSDNPRTEDPLKIIEDIVPGVAGSHYVLLPDRREAIETGIGQAGPGDTVLIAGKGHEDYQIIGTETHPFDDRLVAREALRGRGYGLDR